MYRGTANSGSGRAASAPIRARFRPPTSRRRRCPPSHRKAGEAWTRIALALASSPEPEDRQLRSAIVRYVRHTPTMRGVLARPDVQRELPGITRYHVQPVTRNRSGPEIERQVKPTRGSPRRRTGSGAGRSRAASPRPASVSTQRAASRVHWRRAAPAVDPARWVRIEIAEPSSARSSCISSFGRPRPMGLPFRRRPSDLT